MMKMQLMTPPAQLGVDRDLPDPSALAEDVQGALASRGPDVVDGGGQAAAPLMGRGRHRAWAPAGPATA